MVVSRYFLQNWISYCMDCIYVVLYLRNCFTCDLKLTFSPLHQQSSYFIYICSKKMKREYCNLIVWIYMCHVYMSTCSNKSWHKPFYCYLQALMLEWISSWWVRCQAWDWVPLDSLWCCVLQLTLSPLHRNITAFFLNPDYVHTLLLNLKSIILYPFIAHLIPVISASDAQW